MNSSYEGWSLIYGQPCTCILPYLSNLFSHKVISLQVTTELLVQRCHSVLVLEREFLQNFKIENCQQRHA